MTTQANADTERRRNRRVLFDAPVTLDDANGNHFESSMIDISLKGALVKKPAALHFTKGEAVTLKVSLDNADALICMQASMVHLDDSSIGFYCNTMDMESITHLRRLVELNLGDPELLQRELAALG